MRFFFYKGSSHNIFWSWSRWIYKAPIVLLRLGDIPVRLCCMGILMSMLRRWIWQLNAKLLTFKCSSLGLVYHYDIIFPKGYWVIFSFMFFKLLKVTCIPNWQGIFYGLLKTAFNMNALNTDKFIYFWYYLLRMFSYHLMHPFLNWQILIHSCCNSL